MKSVNGCFPNSDRFMDKDIIRSVTSLYGFTIPDAERDVFSQFVRRRESVEISSLVDMFTLIDDDVFPNVNKLYHILY